MPLALALARRLLHPLVSLGNLQLKAAASHTTMYPGNKRKKLWREEKGIIALPGGRARFSRL